MDEALKVRELMVSVAVVLRLVLLGVTNVTGVTQMREDVILESMSETLARLGVQGRAMGEELELQNSLADGTRDHMEDAHTNMEMADRKITALLGRSGMLIEKLV